ncbi:FGGY family carbohydrate kinase [Isoptericola sp. F-RaC21]|uniref:FGGY-family carbohydrate kinase n=1 Tax=Isoptericola sp. F-RaC21 TaxID=3141452 RepID=UPI00315B95BC
MRSPRRRPVVCGIDIGSTNSKVVAVDADGDVVARAARPTARDTPGRSIDVHALVGTIEEMILEVCEDGYEVHALCSAGIGEDGVLVDTALRLLTPALAWFDPRRQGVFAALRPRLHDDETFDVETDPARALVGWAWSRRHALSGEPSAWIAVADLATVQWTRRPFISDTLASRTAAWRSGDRSWASDRVELTLGSAGLLPAVARAGDVVGEVESPRLRSAGVLAPGAVAVAGGHDHPIGGWGVQQLVPGAVVDSMGTAEVVVAQSARREAARQGAIDVAPGILSHGSTLLRVEELARNVAWASQDVEVGRRIQGILSGALEPRRVLDAGFFLPGHRGGGSPSYSSDAPRDPHVRASAVLGALAHTGRQAVDAVQACLSEPGALRLVGGWARSPGWLRIKSEVHGFRVVPIVEPEVTAVSAALLAAAACGWAVDPARAVGGA